MPQAMPLHLKMSQATSFEKEYPTTSTQFTDYTQRMPAGTKRSRWTGRVVYEGLYTNEAATVMTALDAVGGWDALLYDPVSHQAQTTPLKFYITSKVSVQQVSGDMVNISFEVREDN